MAGGIAGHARQQTRPLIRREIGGLIDQPVPAGLGMLDEGGEKPPGRGDAEAGLDVLRRRLGHAAGEGRIGGKPCERAARRWVVVDQESCPAIADQLGLGIIAQGVDCTITGRPASAASASA